MTTITTNNNSATAAINAGSSLGGATQSASEMSDQFLRLLVSQLKNQDPLNPVDNAQMTSQMAQISTVGGIQSLNTSVTGLNASFLQMQVMQGAALVGRDVTLPGNMISMADAANGGAAGGRFEVNAAASSVRIDVMNAAGVQVDSLSLGAQSAGQHNFSWPNGSGASQTDGYTFKVSASSGTSAVGSTALMQDTVKAVSTTGSALTLELVHSGKVPYTSITEIN
jgi:flagellar basal-body rod modification protein FlgD